MSPCLALKFILVICGYSSSQHLLSAYCVPGHELAPGILSPGAPAARLWRASQRAHVEAVTVIPSSGPRTALQVQVCMVCRESGEGCQQGRLLPGTRSVCCYEPTSTLVEQWRTRGPEQSQAETAGALSSTGAARTIGCQPRCP